MYIYNYNLFYNMYMYIYIYGGFLSHWCTPNHLKLDHDLVLKAMATRGSPILGSPHILV